MCGIVGIVSPSHPDATAERVVRGLRKLEYRGYDSAGVCVATRGELAVRKSAGTVDALERKTLASSLAGTAAIGHTRWATHGKVTDANAHPHVSCNRELAVVHNGVIENYAALKSELQARGHAFRSQTDSEVAVHLLEELSDGVPLEEAVGQAVQRLAGSFAILAVSAREPLKIVAARRESPLLVAQGKGVLIAASDSIPILEYTDRFAPLEDGELAVLDRETLRFSTFDGKPVQKTFITASWKAGESDLGGFAHYMQKEIFEIPASLAAALQQKPEDVRAFADDVKKANRVVLVGCGTARHAALVGRYLLNKVAGKFAEVMIGSEFPYFAHEMNKDCLVLAVSQSGETADVLAGVREAKKRGAKVVSIVNVVGSTLARESDRVLYIRCGPEVGVAATKSFLNQLAVFYLVAFAMAGKYAEGAKAVRNVAMVHVDRTLLENDAKAKRLAEKLKDCPSAYYLARGINFALAVEGALKLKEISYIHAEGMPAGELKHGTLALISDGVPVIAINPADYTHEETLTNVMETKARGALVIGVSDEPNAAYDAFLRIPKVDPLYYPLVAALPLMLLAYHAGVARGVNVDRPRNLAKSVTVR